MRATIVAALLMGVFGFGCDYLGNKCKPVSEGSWGTKKIYEGARNYYVEGAKQFPTSDTPWTPPQGSCCGQPGDKCQPDPHLFEGEPWQSLKFAGSEDPYYFSYRYEGTTTAFTAAASTDLDCDGVFSTYELYGSVDPADGNIRGSYGYHNQKE